MHLIGKYLRFISTLTLISFSSATITACSSTQRYPVNEPAAEVPLEDTVEAASNLVAPGFLFRLDNLEDKSLNGSFRVGFDGKLSLPYNITLTAADSTLEQLQDKVALAYRPYFKGGSKVHLGLVERAYWVDIRGLAAKPGRYLIKQDTTLDEVIAKGGGFLKESPAKFVRITNARGSKAIDLDRYYRTGDPAKLAPWMGGEMIFFQSEEGIDDSAGANGERNTVRFLGEVRRPGDINFRPGASFLYYLSEAGGPTNSVDPNKIQIFRQNTNLQFSMDKAKDFPPLKRGDTVMLYPDHTSPFERFIQSGVGIASIISAIALVIIAGRNR